MSTRVNNQITAKTVFVVDDEGNKIGSMATADALAKAYADGKDLVEIAPNATPPVCKIIDASKYAYEQKKAKKQPKSPAPKEFQFNPNIDPHDLGIKANHMRELLDKGHPIHVIVKFRGRENQKKDRGVEIIDALKIALPTAKFDAVKTEDRAITVNIRK